MSSLTVLMKQNKIKKRENQGRVHNLQSVGRSLSKFVTSSRVKGVPMGDRGSPPSLALRNSLVAFVAPRLCRMALIFLLATHSGG